MGGGNPPYKGTTCGSSSSSFVLFVFNDRPTFLRFRNEFFGSLIGLRRDEVGLMGLSGGLRGSTGGFVATDGDDDDAAL